MKSLGPYPRSSLLQEDIAAYRVPLMSVRNVDGTVLDATGSATAFKAVAGDWGTAGLVLRTATQSAGAGTKTATAQFEFTLPPEYVAAETAMFVVAAKYVQTIAAVSGAIDMEVYELGLAGTVGSDLCGSAVPNGVLTASVAYYGFVVTATGLAAGDVLQCYVRETATTDGAGEGYSEISSIAAYLDIRG